MTVGVSRDIIWVSSSLEDPRRFRELVQKVMGFALFQAQRGAGIFRPSRSKAPEVQASSRSETPKRDMDLVRSRLRLAGESRQADAARKKGKDT